MGACCCCCASKQAELISPSPFYHYPRVPEAREPLSSHHGAVPMLSTGLLVDTNLDTSIQDTYRPPPTPIPYETYAGQPQTPSGNRESNGNKTEAAVQAITTESAEESDSGIKPEDLKGTGDKVQIDIELPSKDVDDDLKKSSEPIVSSLVEEEDVCPTCLEEYDEENPKIITKCEHHFHLACILEWMERSDTCPVCNQEMIFDASTDN